MINDFEIYKILQMYNNCRSLSLSEWTPFIFDMELTHLGSEASYYKAYINVINMKCNDLL